MTIALHFLQSSGRKPQLFYVTQANAMREVIGELAVATCPKHIQLGDLLLLGHFDNAEKALAYAKENISLIDPYSATIAALEDELVKVKARQDNYWAESLMKLIDSGEPISFEHSLGECLADSTWSVHVGNEPHKYQIGYSVWTILNEKLGEKLEKISS